MKIQNYYQRLMYNDFLFISDGIYFISLEKSERALLNPCNLYEPLNK